MLTAIGRDEPDLASNPASTLPATPILRTHTGEQADLFIECSAHGAQGGTGTKVRAQPWKVQPLHDQLS